MRSGYCGFPVTDAHIIDTELARVVAHRTESRRQLVLSCTAYGYTSNEVECSRETGHCTCRDGYKQDSRSCRRRMLVGVEFNAPLDTI